MARTKVLAQGLLEAGHVGAAFKEFVSAVFPFQKQVQSDADAKMVAAMKREVDRGPLKFQAVETNLFQQRAQTMAAPDELRQKLADKVMKERRRRLG